MLPLSIWETGESLADSDSEGGMEQAGKVDSGVAVFGAIMTGI
jgi:hypothetical protein